MFSKSKSKGDKAKKRAPNPDTRPKGNLTQFGLLDVPNVSEFALNQDGDEDESALEAELMALTGGDSKKQNNKKAKKFVAPEVLDQMVAECMKDDSDQELSDIDDQELLAELNELGSEDEDGENANSQLDSDSHTHSDISPTDPESTGIETAKPARAVPTIVRPSPFLAGHSIQFLLTERIAMYEEAVQNAVDSGEDARAKRLKRGLATLNQMMRNVKGGKAINEEDIPPAVLVKTSRANSREDVAEPKRNIENQVKKSLVADPVNNGIEKMSSSATIPQNIAFGLKDEEHVSLLTFSNVPKPVSNVCVIANDSQIQSNTDVDLNVCVAKNLHSIDFESSNNQNNLSIINNTNCFIKMPNDFQVNNANSSIMETSIPCCVNSDSIKYASLSSNPLLNLTKTSLENKTFPFSNNPDLSASQPSPSSECSSVLHRRQLEYKVAAVNAKKTGDMETALHYLKIVKQLTLMIDAARSGQEIDINSIPSSPVSVSCQGASMANTAIASEENTQMALKTLQKEEVLIQHDDEENPSSTAAAIGESNQPTSAPSVPSPISVLDALEQRLLKYTQQRDKAKAEEDSRKERMNNRIMKQYQDAIKGYNAGKAVNFDELPTPPGFPPIPVGTPQLPPSSLSPGAPSTLPSQVGSSSVPSEKAPAPQPFRNDAQLDSKPHRQAPPIPGSLNSSDLKTSNVRKAPQSRVERQLSLLQKRQDQFKEAALEAKKRGEIEQAKEYLRNFKGFDHLIMATNSGLPVDMNTVPCPPQEQISSFNTSIDFEVIDKNDCVIAPPTTPADLAIAYTKLEDDLIAQIKMCAQTREHFKALGDVASSNRFENLIIHTKKDLDAVRVAMKRGDNPPKFHYETRSFTIIQCNTDLNDSDCEVTIMRGINYNVPNPKEIDTCIKMEFPYPSENPPQERTENVKNSNCPEYNHKVVFSIDRKARALSRVFKRHSIKCQVVARGGWFHRDSVIGTAKVPLAALETKCTLHDSFDILDERKKMVGGKLEVKIRVRNPILSKQLEKVTEKWLVIDGF